MLKSKIHIKVLLMMGMMLLTIFVFNTNTANADVNIDIGGLYCEILSEENSTMQAQINDDDITEINIPSSIQMNGKSYTVTRINRKGDGEYSKLKKIIIPNTITTIGEQAFNECENLQEIIIPSSVTTIESRAFCGCKSLKNITIPNNVTTIGDYLFANCTSLQEVILSNKITEIGEWMFSNCENLQEITIPNNVKTIKEYAFRDCTKLQKVKLQEGLNTIKEGAFDNCLSLQNITIPNTVISIGRIAFENCTSLQKIIIPDSVQTIDRDCFWKCLTLKEVSLGKGLKNLSECIFGECESLKELKIPENIKSIGSSAMQGVSDGFKVTIPKSVERFEGTPFENSSNKYYVYTTKGSYAANYKYPSNVSVILIDDLSDDENDNTQANEINNVIVGCVSMNKGMGVIIEGTQLAKTNEQYDEMYGRLKNKGYTNIIGFYELKLISGDIENGFTLTFTLGEENDGKQAIILHKKHDGTYEEFIKIIENGKVDITVTELSPFMIAIKDKTTVDRKKDDTPKTGTTAGIYFMIPVAIISALGIMAFRRKETK